MLFYRNPPCYNGSLALIKTWRTRLKWLGIVFNFVLERSQYTMLCVHRRRERDQNIRKKRPKQNGKYERKIIRLMPMKCRFSYRWWFFTKKSINGEQSEKWRRARLEILLSSSYKFNQLRLSSNVEVMKCGLAEKTCSKKREQWVVICTFNDVT